MIVSNKKILFVFFGFSVFIFPLIFVNKKQLLLYLSCPGDASLLFVLLCSCFKAKISGYSS